MATTKTPAAPKRRGPIRSSHVQLSLFGGPLPLGSPELFTVTVAVPCHGATHRIRAVVDARGYVSLWRDTGPDRRAVAGWSGRWRRAGMATWYRGGLPGAAPGLMHWGDHDALAEAIAARLAEVPPSQILRDQRRDWDATAPVNNAPCGA